MNAADGVDHDELLAAPSVVSRLRAVGTHERAAETHKRAADFFERAAAADRRHGWEAMAVRMEEQADQQREAAAVEQEKADRGRDSIRLTEEGRLGSAASSHEVTLPAAA